MISAIQNFRIWSKSLTILLVAALHWSCNPSEVEENRSEPTTQKSSSSSDASYQDEEDIEHEKVSQPQQVTGSYLACVTTIMRKNVNQYAYGCSIYKDEKRIDLSKSAINVEWRAKAEAPHRIYTNADHHAIYVFDQEISSSDKSPVLSAQITSPEHQLTSKTLEYNLDDLFNKLGARRYMRMALTSVHSRKSNSGSSSKRISTIEINLNGEWFKVVPDLATQSIRLGKYEVELTAKPADIVGALKILTGTEHNISTSGSFSPIQPHDYVDKPMYMAVDFGKDNVVTRGYRINNGEPMTYEEMPTGMVDKYHIELSDNGLDWDIIKESEIDIKNFATAKPLKKLD